MTAKKAELQLKTAKALVESYNNPSIEALIAPRAENCVHSLLPSASLTRTPMTNVEYATFVMNNINKNLSNFKIAIIDIINDPISSKAVIHSMGTAGSPVGPYGNEYAIFLTFNDEGDKIIKEEVFEDSAFTLAFYAKMQDHENNSKK